MDHPTEVHQSLVAQNPSDGDGMIASPAPSTSNKPRIIGVDVARCLALFGMIAAHVFEIFNDDGTPTASTVIAGGRSAATFVVVAGVSVAFLSGGRTVVQGRRRTAAAAGLAVRALLVGAIGLALGLAAAGGVDVILPVYAVMFLLAIPLLGMPPRVLAGIAAAVIVLGPILLVATADAGLPYVGADAQPTLATLVRDPFGLLVLLFITGAYPVVAYLAYLCAGMAIGRCDLSSRLVAWRLLGGGLALAVVARVVSAVLLYPLGGLAHLAALH
ncbi:MAG TPA: heparan-alpha-glucosaminide N-acetyltransferase domain-containing protein, partial [Kineosporiaceae bacterium]|nr:heparan-alpha-glucosaminide N-acetyltransferase domain-containing protein [Kineosporiaceae bacterium]